MRKSKIFILIFIIIVALCGCNRNEDNTELEGLVFEEEVPLEYAKQFSIYRYEGGYSLITVADGRKYLIVPENAKVPKTHSDISIIQRPVKNVYMAATSVMGLFDALEKGDVVRFSGTEAEDWYIDYAKEAMKTGKMLYAGKYKAPDYELLLSEKCTLSIQSTMIDHTPQVKEKLEELGIRVFVDNSSYEEHPLGRSEWIKVYGEMLGEAEKAEELFKEQKQHLDSLSTYSGEKKTVVFFYIGNRGQIVTRKPGDYVTKMIELAGGENILSDIGDKRASSSLTMEPEEFWEKAGNADIIIYNTDIGGELSSIQELKEKAPLLGDMKAVKSGNVWCTKNNLFQETMKLGDVIEDFNKIFNGKDDLTYLYKLKE